MFILDTCSLDVRTLVSCRHPWLACAMVAHSRLISFTPCVRYKPASHLGRRREAIGNSIGQRQDVAAGSRRVWSNSSQLHDPHSVNLMSLAAIFLHTLGVGGKNSLPDKARRTLHWGRSWQNPLPNCSVWVCTFLRFKFGWLFSTVLTNRTWSIAVLTAALNCATSRLLT